MIPLPMLLYWSTSFLTTDFFLHLLWLLFLKRKSKSQLKVYILLIGCIVCFICSLYFIIYKWESFSNFHLFGGPLSSFLNTYLKYTQKKTFSGIDINSCQIDTESIGAFWAHQAFDAYYKKVLQSIKDRMTLYEKENNFEFFVKKLIIVIPLSCDVRNVLTDKDKNIEEIGVLPSIECDQGGNINRQLKNPVYRIEFLHKIIYIVAEYPSTLNTLWKMKDVIGMEKCIYHRDCFIKTLKFLVKDSPCIVIEYDDTDPEEYLSNFLLSKLQKM